MTPLLHALQDASTSLLRIRSPAAGLGPPATDETALQTIPSLSLDLFSGPRSLPQPLLQKYRFSKNIADIYSLQNLISPFQAVDFHPPSMIPCGVA